MTLPNYGLPESTELLGAVRQQVAANHDALTTLYQQVGAPVVATIHNNDTALSMIAKTLRTAVRRSASTQDRRLGTVEEALGLAPDPPPDPSVGPMPTPVTTTPYTSVGPMPTPATTPLYGPPPPPPPPAAPTANPPVPAAACGERVPFATVTLVQGDTLYALGQGGTYTLTGVPVGPIPDSSPAGSLFRIGDTLYVYGGPCGVIEPPPPYVPPPPPYVPPPPPPSPTECPPCQECPEPPAPVVSPPAAVTCALPTALMPGQYPVGSPEWCQAAEALRDGIVALGQALIEVGKGNLSVLGTPAQCADTSSGVIWTGILAGLSSVRSGAGPVNYLGQILGGLWPCIASQLRDAVVCWTQVVAALAPCDATSLVAIGVVRAAIGILHKLRLGTDAAIWATLDMAVHLDPIERVCEYLMESLCPAEIPGVGDAIECYLRGTATEEQLRCWMLMRGADWSVWRPVLDARREQLTAPEYIQWARRHGLPQQTQVDLLRKLGWTHEEEAKARVELYDELPTVADIIHFLTRNVYDTSYVADYRLTEGFEERFWANYGPTCEAIGLSKYWASQHFAAHWILPAVGQLREMVHRLRADKPGVQHPFTVVDFGRALAEQDVAPYFRERFTETVYNVPALGYVRDMYRSYVLSDDELRSVHRDLGYSPEDSERFTAIDRLIRARMRAAEAHGWTPAALAHGYISGRLTAEDVTARMAGMGYTADESSQLMARAQADLDYSTFMRARSRTIFAVLSQVKQALTVGVIGQQAAAQQLQAMGWSAAFAQSWAQITGVQGRVAVVKQGVSTIRGAYYRGEVNPQQAAQLLQQLGIVPEAIDQYVTLWGVKLTRKRRTLSKAEIIKELCEGAISIGDAVARLANLGYEAPDIELYIADAGRCIASRRSKAEAAAARQAASESKTLLKLQQEAARQAKQLLREAEKAEPVSKLQKWAKLGIIQAAYFARRMRRYGYSNAEITDYWQEAASAKGSNADAAAIGPALQGPGNREPGSFAGSAAP